jgi:hypothetical protein
MSQAALAELVNAEILRSTGSVGAVSAKSISDWERGWYSWPVAPVRAALCAVLGVGSAAGLGFRKRRMERPPRAESSYQDLGQPASLIDLVRSEQDLPSDAVGYVEVPGGRTFLGAGLVVQHCEANSSVDGRIVPDVGDRAAAVLTRPDLRTVLVATDRGADVQARYLLDGRTFISRRPASAEVPAAFILDDFTIGIVWAVTNTDTAILADDMALDFYRRRLVRYEDLPSSSATQSEAPDLNEISRQWLGSYFCAGHITRNLSRLSSPPIFWTRERRGEEAASWLLWTHKLEYLRHTSSALPGLKRGFCVPEHEVHASPRYERVVLLLAMALMEAFGVTVEVSVEPDFQDIEGFVLGETAIVANWLRAPGLWYVETHAPVSRRSVYAEVAQRSSAHSIIAQPTPARRLEAMAGYLDIPWPWFRKRCQELAYGGVDGLAHPRSRLLSTEGLTRALQYVAYLDKISPTSGANLARS